MTYPPASAPAQRWAWEFLRRNARYRAAFAAASERAPYARILVSEADRSRYAVAGASALVVNGPAIAAPAEELARLEREWGITPLADPDQADAWRALDPVAGELDVYTGRAFDRARPLDPHEALVRFDLALPIDDQLRSARTALALAQAAAQCVPVLLRQRSALFRDYLRILDLRAERRTWAAIADALDQGRARPSWDEDRVRKAHAAAVALSERGYRALLATRKITTRR